MIRANIAIRIAITINLFPFQYLPSLKFLENELLELFKIKNKITLVWPESDDFRCKAGTKREQQTKNILHSNAFIEKKVL